MDHPVLTDPLVENAIHRMLLDLRLEERHAIHPARDLHAIQNRPNRHEQMNNLLPPPIRLNRAVEHDVLGEHPNKRLPIPIRDGAEQVHRRIMRPTHSRGQTP